MAKKRKFEVHDFGDDVMVTTGIKTKKAFIDKKTLTGKVYTHGGKGYYAHGLDWVDIKGNSVEDLVNQSKNIYRGMIKNIDE